LYTFTGGADGGGPDLEKLVKIGGDVIQGRVLLSAIAIS
jgi:hypothetical protein